MISKLASLFFIFLIFVPNLAISDDSGEGILNRLLAPGPLMSGHHNLEGKDCLKCHDAGKGISQTKCLACHKVIKVEVIAKTGYHGLAKEACIECHADHKGRDFDSTKLDRKIFDHNLTGYPLEGKHAQIKCEECHTEKRTQKATRTQDILFTGAKSSCISCHKKNDIHSFKGDFAKKDCVTCHSLKSWKEGLKFNHDRDTKFKLQARHAELKCATCHGPNKKQATSQYRWSIAAKQCTACHANFHKTNLSPRFSSGKCDACHSQNAWKINDFDHSAVHFELRGKHAQIKCEECHKQNPKTLAEGIKSFHFAGLKSDCLICHKDFHKFANHSSKTLGNLNHCLSCHTENSWQKTHNFNHDTSTRYPIDGKHSELKCDACHLVKLNSSQKNSKLVAVYHLEKLSQKTCENCHASPHAKSFSKVLLQKKCTECHVTDSWSVFKKDGKRFDHAKTRFELTGKHASLSCKDCHEVNKKQVYKFSNPEGHFCTDCHKTQHETQFSASFNQKTCTECHSTKSFSELNSFDHNQTRYPLKGSHLDLKCNSCHVATAQVFEGKSAHAKGKFLFPELDSKSCSTCHSDFHKGQLGQDCAKCHNETKWTQTQFEHNKQSRFLLTGAHLQAKCQDCHKASSGQKVAFENKNFQVVQFKPLSTECSSCHADFHKGQLGNSCSSCHSTEKWKPTYFDHNKQSRFKISGKHSSLACDACHKTERGETVKFENKEFKLTRFKPKATACASCHKDVHDGGFGKTCEECHSDKSWKQTKDFHKNFSLSGVHFTLNCNECHFNNRKLSGLSQDCFFCHQKDDIHNGSQPNCKDCHKQQFWEVTQFRHSLSRFPLTGSHRTIDCSSCHMRNIFQGTPTMCGSCHLQQALSVTTPPHMSFSNINSCGDCHNTFTFTIAK